METRRCGAPRWGFRGVLFVVALSAQGLCAAAVGAAEGMEVEPGQWEMTSTTSNPATGEPQSMTVTECIEGGSLHTGSFLRDAAGCEISDIQTSTTSMRWKMRCTAAGGQMNGQAQVRSTHGGKKVAGTLKMTTRFGGQAMELSSEWAGRWVGPCPR